MGRSHIHQIQALIWSPFSHRLVNSCLILISALFVLFSNLKHFDKLIVYNGTSAKMLECHVLLCGPALLRGGVNL